MSDKRTAPTSYVEHGHHGSDLLDFRDKLVVRSANTALRIADAQINDPNGFVSRRDEQLRHEIPTQVAGTAVGASVETAREAEYSATTAETAFADSILDESASVDNERYLEALETLAAPEPTAQQEEVAVAPLRVADLDEYRSRKDRLMAAHRATTEAFGLSSVQTPSSDETVATVEPGELKDVA